MANQEIRLQYSGYIVFAAKMLSVATGLAFQLMVARGTTALEYDVWFNIRDILAYFTLLATALPFWTMRYVARDREGAEKTGVLANLMISILATAIYVPLIPLILSALNVDFDFFPLYLIVSAQIIELYSIQSLQASLQATKPHVVGYGLLVAETCKVALGYLLIVVYKQPLMGALLSLVVAFGVQILYYLKLLSSKLSSSARWDYVKDWLKGSLAKIYSIVGNQMATTVFIILFAYGGEGARGRYGLAAQIASVITYSSFLAFALYPKLLSHKDSRDITVAIRMVMMLAIPMCLGAISLADSYVIIMRSVYEDAWPILTVLALEALFTTGRVLFREVVFGMERFDEQSRISFAHLLKSRLFIAFSLPYVHSAITIPTTFYVLQFHAQNQPFEAALYVSVINTISHLVWFLSLFLIAKRSVTFEIPWKNIANYILASIVMAAILFAMPRLERIYLTLVATAIGGCIYLAMIVAIDKEARLLMKGILQQIKILR